MTAQPEPICRLCSDGCHGYPLPPGEYCSCVCHGPQTQSGGGAAAATSIRVHRSTAYVKSSQSRQDWRRPEPITAQFRFVLRMAYACHQRRVPYDLRWSVRNGVACAETTVAGDIPMPKALPKPARLRLVAEWKPAIWDAEYRLDAYHDATRNRRCPGFVIGHSSGLSLVHPSETGELGADGEDIRENWRVTHAASGLGFGLTQSFKRAVDALLLAASFPLDWTQPVDSLQRHPEFQRAGLTVRAAYGDRHTRDHAQDRLADLERAA